MLSIINQRNFLAIVVLATSSSVLSKDISYDFIEGKYAYTTLDAGDVDIHGNGFEVGGSSSGTQYIAITSSFVSTDLDSSQGVYNRKSLSVGLTAHTLIANSTSVFGNFSILIADREISYGFNSFDDSDTGNIITVGSRYMATDAIELELAFAHTRIFGDKENAIELGARFYVDKKFSLGIGYTKSRIDADADVDVDVDIDSIQLNARIDM